MFNITITLDEFTDFILKFMDDNFNFLGNHCRHTANICLKIADKLNISQEDKKLLKYGSLLHDIGKLYIPRAILLAPRKLTDKEFEIVKEHPVFGDRIIGLFISLKPVSPFILYHHYRQGYGYPDSSYFVMPPANTILIDILTVADSYAAIDEKRPYNGNKNIKPIDILKNTNDTKNKGINREIVDVLSTIAR
ncbi:MAG: HD-GYP domain-containing protein [bacterium]